MSHPPEAPVARYDRLITNPMIRAYYGDSLFYNVGLWSPGTPDQEAASAALVERLLASIDAPRDVLDVGCGLGGTARAARRRWPHARIAAVNISAHQVELCRAAVPGVDFRVMDATRLDLPDASVDLVLSVEAAFHFDTRRDFLREAHRVLRPGGTIAMADLLLADGPTARSIAVWEVHEANHLADPGSYASLLASVGFADARVDDVTADSWLAWCDAVERWIGDHRDHPAVTPDEEATWRASLPRLRAAVRHYLTAVARKPCGA